MRTRVLFAVAFIVLLGAGWRAMRGLRSEPAAAQLVGATMGGDWSVRFRSPLPRDAADRVQREIQTTLDALERQMSTWMLDSDLSRFNRSTSTDWQPVPRELAEVVVEAQRVSAQTGGAFDVTVAPLVNLWGFGPSTAPSSRSPRERIPSDRAITNAKSRVGYAHLDARLDPPALRKRDAAVTVDLSAVAQGYAADRVSDQLSAGGYEDHLVNVCGEIRARGDAGGNDEPWRVGIQAPVPDTLRAFQGVALTDLALATSGDYQHFFDHEGTRYSHEIDPRTGRPIAHALVAVSVAHPSAASADALATGLLVLGPSEAWAVARRDRLAALLVLRTHDGFQTRATPEFRRLQRPASATAPSNAKGRQAISLTAF